MRQLLLGADRIDLNLLQILYRTVHTVLTVQYLRIGRSFFGLDLRIFLRLTSFLGTGTVRNTVIQYLYV